MHVRRCSLSSPLQSGEISGEDLPRGIHRLTDAGTRAEKAQGRHSDGGGLYLNVTSTGTKSWLFMWVVDGKRREMGLGAYPAIGLAKARAKAVELREAVAAGRDPIAEKRQIPEPRWRTGENPAAWKGNLSNLLPRQTPKRLRGHQPALRFEDMPAFMDELALQQGLSARALELTILTAARTGETLAASWKEFDLAKKLWTVPSERMKAREEHVVPLSDRAVSLLERLAEAATNKYLFPSSTKPEQPLSNMAMLMLLRRMKKTDISVHGSARRTRPWASPDRQFRRWRSSCRSLNEYLHDARAAEWDFETSHEADPRAGAN